MYSALLDAVCGAMRERVVERADQIVAISRCVHVQRAAGRCWACGLGASCAHTRLDAPGSEECGGCLLGALCWWLGMLGGQLPVTAWVGHSSLLPSPQPVLPSRAYLCGALVLSTARSRYPIINCLAPTAPLTPLQATPAPAEG